MTREEQGRLIIEKIESHNFKRFDFNKSLYKYLTVEGANITRQVFRKIIKDDAKLFENNNEKWEIYLNDIIFSSTN